MNVLHGRYHHNAMANIPDIVFSDIHYGVYVLVLSAWGWVIGAFWFAFGSDRHSAFMVGISTIYFLIFFSVPLILARTGRKFISAKPNSQSFKSFLRSRVDTATCEMSGREAAVQIALVPVCLALCTTGIAIAVIFARNAFPV